MFFSGGEDEEKSLDKLLIFLTGAKVIPALGFRPKPQLHFRHPYSLPRDDPTREFPVVNTCANVLSLPVLDSYDTFKQRMGAAMEVETFTTT